MTYVYRKEDAEGTFTIVNETMNALYEAVEKAINTRVDRCVSCGERHWLTALVGRKMPIHCSATIRTQERCKQKQAFHLSCFSPPWTHRVHNNFQM